MPADPQWLFADLLVDDGQTALLLDGNGYVLGGLYVDQDGNDLSQEIGAELSGISDEVRRATQAPRRGRMALDHVRDAGRRWWGWRRRRIRVCSSSPRPSSRRSVCCAGCSSGARNARRAGSRMGGTP